WYMSAPTSPHRSGHPPEHTARPGTTQAPRAALKALEARPLTDSFRTGTSRAEAHRAAVIESFVGAFDGSVEPAGHAVADRPPCGVLQILHAGDHVGQRADGGRVDHDVPEGRHDRRYARRTSREAAAVDVEID